MNFKLNIQSLLRLSASFRIFLLLVILALAGWPGHAQEYWTQKGSRNSLRHENQLIDLTERITQLQQTVGAITQDRNVRVSDQSVVDLRSQIDGINAQLKAHANGDEATIKALTALIQKIRSDLDGFGARLDKVAPPAPSTPTPSTPAPAAAGDQSTLVKDLAEVKSATDRQGVALNIVWTLLAGFLVMFMQAGFALVETGFVRAKNAAHTMAMNFMVYCLAMLGYWICGFAFQMGGIGDKDVQVPPSVTVLSNPGAEIGDKNATAPRSVAVLPDLGAEIGGKLNRELGFSIGDKFFGLLGWAGFFLQAGLVQGGLFALFLFQMVFMDTAATIPTGAMVERWRFRAFCWFSVAVGALIYPVYANWVWGGGWLAALGKNFNLGHGVVDFAGSSVVHLCGGTIAFVGAKMLKERKGRYPLGGEHNPMPSPHNIPLGVLGTFILAFGWFGFNAGSTLAGTSPHIGQIATNTMLASAAGATLGMIVSWNKWSKPSILYMCNGMLAGLVGITAPCAFVGSIGAVIIGAVAGVVVFFAAQFVEWLEIDDPVGAISVHGFCGLWGILAVGIFANGECGHGWNGVAGPVERGFGQFVAQLIGAVACIVTTGGLTGAILWVLNHISKKTRLRASDVDQDRGLDLSEFGVSAYEDPCLR